MELGRGGRQTGSPRGSSGWRGAREWGRNRLPSGPVTGGESHPSPLPSPAWLAAPGAEEEREVVLGILDGLSSTLDTTVRLGGWGGGTVHGILGGLKGGVSLIQVLA